MSRESQKTKFRKLVISSLSDDSIRNNSTSWNPNIITELLITDEPYNSLTYEEREIVMAFYSKVIKYFYYADIDWDKVKRNSKWDSDGILSIALTKIIIDENHDENNRLIISDDLIKRLMFEKWEILDNNTNRTLIYYVPKQGSMYYSVDMSRINFDNVVFDFKLFLKKYLLDKDRYKILECPNTDFMIEDEAVTPFQKEEEVEEFEEYQDNDWALDDSTYEDIEYPEFHDPIFTSDDDMSPEEIKEFHDESFKYTEYMIDNMDDLYFDFIDTNAKINFKTNIIGSFVNCDFSGTDLSNSKLEECDGIHMKYCNFYNTNVAFPFDQSNMQYCASDNRGRA